MTPDPVDPVSLARSLVDIDSTTGREGKAGAWLAGYLRGRRWSVIEQPVADARSNIVATSGDRIEVVLSTHYDCVPPFFPSRVEGDRLHGRGSCDAKGILAAQVAAADALVRRGETRVGLLFVVGEERGSDGARAANRIAPAGCRYLVDGEPTDSRLGLATRGALRIRLRAKGRAAHSSYPELGESAIDTLVDTIVSLRAVELPSDPILGRTHYTVGLISGGVAPNVVSPSAEAELMFRTVSGADRIMEAIAPLATKVEIEHLLDVPLVELTTVPGIETAVFPYTTDIPFLSAWGRPLLFGPGSIHDAHTANESISIAELMSAVDRYALIAERLLALGAQL
jgi:acetylornithine deacetylase